MGKWKILLFLLGMGLVGCIGGADEVEQGSDVTVVWPATVPPSATAVPSVTAVPLASATTAATLTRPLPPTHTPQPSSTPLPTNTAVPTNPPLPPTAVPVIPTNTAVPPTAAPVIPTNTAVPATPLPTIIPSATPIPIPPTEPPPLSGNLLPNGSFEEGHYNQWGVPELQLPNGWRLEWDEGATGYGNESWDVWVRPETRVLPDYQLPPSEHGIFIYDGTHTVKIFKGYGAISVRLLSDLTLSPGTYRMTINIYPDLYTDFVGGQKVWASDPASGEVRFIISGGSGGTGWIRPAFGQRNTMTHDFTITEAQGVTVGLGIKGPFAIVNNGWVMDAWSLEKISN